MPERVQSAAERASGLDDIRHRFVAGYVWEIPWGKSLKSAAGFLLAGWQRAAFSRCRAARHSTCCRAETVKRGVLLVGAAELGGRCESGALSTRSRAMVQYVGIFAQRRNVGASPRDPLTGSHSAHHRSFRFEDTRHGIASGAIPHGIF